MTVRRTEQTRHGFFRTMRSMAAQVLDDGRRQDRSLNMICRALRMI